MKVLAVCGSLREHSSNLALLEAMALAAPPSTEVAVFRGLGELPAFNPDDEGREPAPDSALASWKLAVKAADAVVFSTPEYAHGLPGTLKNALDWLVGSGELMEKPVAVLNPSPRSQFATPQLVEVLGVMSARVIHAAAVSVQPPRRDMSAKELASHPELGPRLVAAWRALSVTMSSGA